MNAPERWQSALRDLLATHESPPRPAASSWLARTRLFGGARLPRAPGPMEQRSLFGEILDWLFAPVLLLWPLSVGITFFVARSLSDAPFDRALIDPALLGATERDWLDAYHARVLAEVGPMLEAPVQGWLRAACAPI